VQVSLESQRPARFTIVGAAIYPTFSDALGLGQGAALTLGVACPACHPRRRR
jgi:hypothetical protein